MKNLFIALIVGLSLIGCTKTKTEYLPGPVMKEVHGGAINKTDPVAIEFTASDVEQDDLYYFSYNYNVTEWIACPLVNDGGVYVTIDWNTHVATFHNVGPGTFYWKVEYFK